MELKIQIEMFIFGNWLDCILVAFKLLKKYVAIFVIIPNLNQAYGQNWGKIMALRYSKYNGNSCTQFILGLTSSDFRYISPFYGNYGR